MGAIGVQFEWDEMRKQEASIQIEMNIVLYDCDNYVKHCLCNQFRNHNETLIKRQIVLMKQF